jgi:hypothetical protein
MKKILSYEDALAIFNYNENTGVLTWKSTRGSSKAGTQAGHITKAGYRYVHTCGKIYPAHRLAWLLVYKEYVTSDIDHINRIKTDNRISNLRVVSRQENSRNKGLTKANKSGIKGVSLNTRTGKWISQIRKDGCNLVLGEFKTKEEAGAAYVEASKSLSDYTPIPTIKLSLTKELVGTNITYLPEEGIFVWKKNPEKPFRKIRGAGYTRPDGYISISLGGTKRLAHVLAWFITTGELPKGQIDHINRNRSDNRISNLRVVTPKENSRNRSTSKQI